MIIKPSINLTFLLVFLNQFQLQVERNVKEVYDNYRRLTKVIENFPLLKREDHIRYLMNSIVYLPRTYEVSI